LLWNLTFDGIVPFQKCAVAFALENEWNEAGYVDQVFALVA
jgi:hypothetical protein